MAKHHIVQDKYLTQWRKTDTENQLNIYSVLDNKYIEKGPRWKGFWRKDFNVLDDDKNRFYLPENVTAIIDTRGIETIRKIDCIKQNELSDEERSCVAFYVALQYIRTPRYREETNKFMEATIKYFMKKDISSPEKISISKDEILKHNPKDKHEQEAIEKIKDMSDEEIKNEIFDSLHNNGLHICLTNTGHSKNILKIEKLAKGLFEVQWLFLIAPKDSAFVSGSQTPGAYRFDLTLECIRLFYSNEESPLKETLDRYYNYFELFEDFKGYCEYFLLQDLVSNDYSEINFFLPFNRFKLTPLPNSVFEYYEYKKNNMKFVTNRNKRMEEYGTLSNIKP